jgi:protocatechuate 3,4-dioxygenase beta subunit
MICIVGVALFVMMFSVANALGCSCMGPGTPCQAYGSASAVFVGTAIAVRTAERTADTDREGIDYWAPRTFKFTVEQSFLGIQTIEVEISTGMGGGDCGYGFKLGSRYVIYAYQFPKTNRLTTSICTRTKPFDDSGDDLGFLRSVASRSPGVTISGEVKRGQQNVAKGDSSEVGPVANMGLVVEGEGERREIQTDGKGRYSLTGLRPGKYKVTLLLPDELFTYRAEQEITVANRGCAVVSYSVVDNGRLSGRVLDPEGQSTHGVLLALIEADDPDPIKHFNRLERTDDQGRYSFSALPPGRYLLAVNLTRYPEPEDRTNAYPRTYYLGVSDISKAEVITLGAGENVRERDLQLPTRRAPSIVSGKVVWADGTPVANAGISFRDVTYHDPKMNHGMQADENGYFTIKGYVGQILVIEARSNRPYFGDRQPFQPMERVEPVRIVLGNPTEVLKIIITKLR